MHGRKEGPAWADLSKMPDMTLHSHPSILIARMNAMQLSHPGNSQAHMKSADVLHILDDGVAVPCHSQILPMHSAVLCNMLDVLAASQHDEKVKVPLTNFTEAQCFALLAYQRA